jgi:hypothetical protein
MVKKVPLHCLEERIMRNQLLAILIVSSIAHAGEIEPRKDDASKTKSAKPAAVKIEEASISVVPGKGLSHYKVPIGKAGVRYIWGDVKTQETFTVIVMPAPGTLAALNKSAKLLWLASILKEKDTLVCAADVHVAGQPAFRVKLRRPTEFQPVPSTWRPRWSPQRELTGR